MTIVVTADAPVAASTMRAATIVTATAQAATTRAWKTIAVIENRTTTPMSRDAAAVAAIPRAMMSTIQALTDRAAVKDAAAHNAMLAKTNATTVPATAIIAAGSAT